MIVFGEAHLRRVLKAYASYYNEVRTHFSLDKNGPDFRRSSLVGDIAAVPILGGCITNTSGFRCAPQSNRRLPLRMRPFKSVRYSIRAADPALTGLSVRGLTAPRPW